MSRPLTCATTTCLGPSLTDAALRLGAGSPVTPGDLVGTPTCYLQARHRGPHYGLALDLEAEDGSAVWAVWLHGGGPHLIVIPACPGRSDTGMDVCTEPDGHVGGHTWQVRDPLLDVARAQLARMSLPGS
ncbi:hypothetical protein [Actinacidiphila sp. bgisy145]|uniref:hypothetical protein n=1 Tax=Actinacidiphila sp. bgisy145 TaxID=3413792 RepID=UPI003EBFA1C9